MTLKENTWVIDCEGDGLKPNKIHVLSVANTYDEVLSTDKYEQMRKFLTTADTLICHNIQRFDKPELERVLNIQINGRIIDTLPLSWALFPDRKKHGLESWGITFGVPKPPIDDWENLTPEEYEHRCTEDVKINFRLWEVIHDKLKKLYDNPEDMNRYIDYLSFKMRCARIKEDNGWKLDVVQAEQTLEELEAEKETKIGALREAMPKIPVKSVKRFPKRAYNKDGALTKLGAVWFERLKELNLPEDTQEVEVVTGYEEPNPGSNQQIKDWLSSLGWKPETFKYVKDETTGKKREIAQINLPPQKGGGVCPSIKKLFDREPRLELLDGLSILSHRIGILRGFLDDVSPDGYLRAKVAGFTNTLRLKHAELVNLPRTDRPYAKAIRGSLTVLPGELLCGSDMSSLEDRLKQHFIWPYDPQYVKEMMTDDYDPHLSLALSAGAISNQQRLDYLSGIDKSIKPIRDIYKNGNYACQYNAYPPTLARTCGISLDAAKEVFDAYWKKNWAIKEAVKAQKVKYLGEEMWLLNPVSKFWYSLRSENDIFSTLVQGTASFVFDVYLGFVLQEYDVLIGDFHDEFILRLQEELKQQVENICLTAIKKTNDFLKLNRQLDVGIQWGTRYSEIH